MLRIMPASTLEIDDPEAAVEEILGQIDVGGLLEHTVGIFSCELDFMRNGVVEALGEALPFDIIGSTSNINAICGEAGDFQLSLMVLTSDDIFFSCGITEALTDGVQEKVDAMYRETAARLPGPPRFGILIASFMLALSGDAQLKALDNASGNLPIFGCVTEDYTDAIRDPRVAFNGKDYDDRMVLLLVAGDVEPRFFFKAIPDECFSAQKAIITSSQGNLLMEVNNMPAVAYIETLGLAKDGAIESIPSVPLSVDVGDGAQPVARAILATTPEGFVACGGEMPQGAVIGVGSIDPSVVRGSSGEMARDVLDAGLSNGALIVSCLSRNMALGLDTLAEVEQVESILGDSVPYLFLYSAGEIYPEKAQGKTFNKAHNDSIIACVF